MNDNVDDYKKQLLSLLFIGVDNSRCANIVYTYT